MRRVGELSDTPNQPNFLSNLDCTPLTYRMVANDAMQNGCFTATAFGMMDSSSEVVIFNGTDEGLPLIASSYHQVLTPWPGAVNLVALDAADVGGSYLGIYKNPLSLMQDQRDSTGKLIGKKLTGAPEISFKDPSGQRLRINPQTMAFSSSGSWMVAETLNGFFVRINLATLDMVAFAPAFGSQGSPALLKSQVAVSHDGRFVAIENNVAGSFNLYDLNTCADTTSGLQLRNCQSYDYWPFLNKRIGDLRALRHVRLVNDSLLSFEAISSDNAQTGAYDLAPTDDIKSLADYVALGDSYTSGEGAFDYLAGTDTASNKCHLSARSYPLLLTHDLFTAAGGHSVACSGAAIEDIASNSDTYFGQVSGGTGFRELSQQVTTLNNILSNYSVGYIPQHRFVQHYQPRIVTVSVGGNDIGFGDLLQKCVMPHVSRHISDSTCYNTYESRAEIVQLVDRTIPRWVALYKQLHTESPEAQVYAIGYPSIASDTGACGLNVHLNRGELEFAEELITYMNSAISQAANTAGVSYVDISHALAGHRLCEGAAGSIAVNGLTTGKDSGVFGLNFLGLESYHPNALGQALIEEAILKQTDNFTLETKAATGNSSNLLNAPKTGATISHIVPVHFASSVLRLGNHASIQIHGMQNGLLPNSSYTVRLDGLAGSVLATVLSTYAGDIVADIPIPATVAPGSHTIDLIGTNQAGEQVDVDQPVYITYNDNDADGDGISDSLDSCPYAINSGVDMDQDGVDDVCDNLIESARDQSSDGTSPGDTGMNSSGGITGRNEPPPPVTGTRDESLAPPSNTGILQPAQPGVSVLTNEISSPIRATLSLSQPQTLPIVIASWLNEPVRDLVLSAMHHKKSRASSRLPRNFSTGEITGGTNADSRALHNFVLAFTTVSLLLILMATFRTGSKTYVITVMHKTLLKPGLCSTIVLMRKFGTFVFAVILFLSLIGFALSVSSNIAFSHPDKVKSWLNQSNLYGNVISDAAKQAQQSGDGNSPAVALSDPAVQKIARSTFSSQLLQKNVATVVDSNYAWLEGKKSSPDFRIDLTSGKQDFAQKVGDYVQSYLSGLPTCTGTQLAAIDTNNPLSLQCRPANMDPGTIGADVTDQIENSAAFLSDPIITASNLNPKGDNESQPYYQNLSGLPAVYQFGTKLPLIAGLVAIASAIAVIFIPRHHRNGVRTASIVLVLAGLVLVIVKFVSGQVFDVVHGHLFHASDSNQVQQAVIDFLHHAESQLAKTEFWFGVGYIVLATVILLLLRRTAKTNSGNGEPSLVDVSDSQTPSRTKPTSAEDIRLKSPRPAAANNTPKQPPRRKPPRLIQ